MPTLRPFRNYDEKDTINLYTYSGSIPVNKGTFVKVTGPGFVPGAEILEMLGSAGSFSPAGTVAQRYGTIPKVAIANSGDKPLGMLLFDVAEFDENGYQLKFNPKKAAEMEICLSGQTVPIISRGMFQYSGVVNASGITAGGDAYITDGGVPSTSGTFKIGKFMGVTGADQSVMLLINCL